ncbi:hypothetical protein BGZ96_004170 [Linnemannia gamsii]|uniref:F-box domain-containing protein n=1 Tax=Linnemannia gamsii TaxID=64522 RepID=A0ABQ7JIJ1_9FUNG|nr:hypothetical protein BGZ96_004170 [Linnemannia gamsii]
MTTTSDPTPFDLPEIRAHIGSFLDNTDRLNCILINKPWHSTMTSLLWEKVTLVLPLQNTSVPPNILKKNASLIKTLIIQSDLIPEYYDIVFPILQTVSFWPKRPQPYPREPSVAAFEGLTKLIKQNPSIIQLKLGMSKGRVPAPDTLWEAMAEAQNLQLLEAPRMRIRHTTMPLFWKATENLRVLIVNFESALRFGRNTDGTGGPLVFPRLKRLSLEVSQGAHIIESEQIRLMAQCPQLETLDWIPDQAFSPEKFLECCKAETWPNLEGLTLARLDLYTDSDIKVIVESMIVEVLASCKKLRKFAAGCVSAKDLVASPPWICGSLRELWIYFDMSIDDVLTDPILAGNETTGAGVETEQQDAAMEKTQRQIFERISGLEMLQSFSFSDPTREIPLRSLDLRLGKGLELLSSLRELKGIHFHGTQQWMRTEDVEWMLDHWDHLHWMGGVMDMDDLSRNDALVKMITDRGVFFAS